VAGKRRRGRVIGIKYAGQKDYDRYINDYLKFKGSLKQYADGL
jgi:hypothetical protein